jgi:hypothetical protein
MDDGLLSSESVAQMALKYMSDDDIQDMLRVNEVSDL